MHAGQRQVAIVERHQGQARTPTRSGPPQEEQETVEASEAGAGAQEHPTWPGSRGRS